MDGSQNALISRSLSLCVCARARLGVDGHEDNERGGATTAPKRGGLGKQRGHFQANSTVGGVGQGRSYTSGKERGFPKVSPDFPSPREARGPGEEETGAR